MHQKVILQKCGYVPDLGLCSKVNNSKTIGYNKKMYRTFFIGNLTGFNFGYYSFCCNFNGLRDI